MNVNEEFSRHFEVCPLVAIIRGVTPGEVEAIGDVLIEAGIRIIEVPLNSPEPFDSIARLARRVGDQALVGAGTVLNTENVEKVRQAGGRLIVAPNFNEAVVNASVAAEMVSMPGVFTPSEALAALDAGANALKLFPAEAASPKMVRAMRAVLPREAPLIIVGGVAPEAIPAWIEGGASGFGLGSGLYKPGKSAADVLETARAYVAAVQR
jgi:2-dehydro-3-deoxyphosphogalactonate aldolase